MSSVVCCSKCHKVAYRLVENNDNIKVVQAGRTILNVNKKAKVSMDIGCPSGHPVKLKIGEGNGTG